MFTLYVKDTFSAAHRIDDYHGKCEALHGHNFKVEAFFEGQEPRAGGMVVDFKILKGLLREVLSYLDHRYLNEIDFFKERAGSSEYIALYIYGQLKGLLNVEGVTLKEVRVWESDSAYAAYRE
ncbi:MAG TPA: 6-carboxytetrahydropterin synthase [Syntrophorhabdaceae bacterium]|nr:6-carboxytetrahydropterin synthase [Syntrophorhabdaceae bacterium]HOT41435.1 6-carboxytetrahydropterin synthase [Syntrophorhabdaceae bacterium]HQE79808.1 6-carboxytetrahydropterin synthase [Syntrophorhabdaceae bacterium]